MAKFKPNGHIWGLEFNRYVCFSFRGNQTIFTEIGQIPYLTLKIQSQGHNENRPKSNQVIYRSGPTIVPQMKEIQKVVQKLLHEEESTPLVAPYKLVQKHKSHPWYTRVI